MPIPQIVSYPIRSCQRFDSYLVRSSHIMPTIQSISNLVKSRQQIVSDHFKSCQLFGSFRFYSHPIAHILSTLHFISCRIKSHPLFKSRLFVSTPIKSSDRIVSSLIKSRHPSNQVIMSFRVGSHRLSSVPFQSSNQICSFQFESYPHTKHLNISSPTPFFG